VNRQTNSEHQHGGDIGKESRADRDDDRIPVHDPEALYNRKGKESVGRHKRSYKHGGINPIAQEMRHPESCQEREGEGQHPEQERLVFGAVKLHEVDLETDKEHEEQLADRREEAYDGPVLGEESETMRAEQEPRQ